MARLDPIEVLFGGVPDIARGDYHDLDTWATSQGMMEDEVARFLLAFVTALFVKTGCPDLTLVRFVAKCADLARCEMARREPATPRG
jgi:hypothetical protein